MNTHCPVCKDTIEQCPYGGDCGEMQLIARERQREINADIDTSDMVTCADCRSALAEPGELYCYGCQEGYFPGEAFAEYMEGHT